MKYIEVEGFKIPVKVVEERTVYGRQEYKIIPRDGSGERWVTISKLLESAEDKKVVT